MQTDKIVPHPNDPSLRSFIDVAPTSDFPIQNLPYGVFSAKDGLAARIGVEMPIVSAVCRVLYEAAPANAMVEELLSRQLKAEF